MVRIKSSVQSKKSKKKVLKKAKENKASKIRVGYAESTDFKIHESIGSKGIQVMILETTGRKKLKNKKTT